MSAWPHGGPKRLWSTDGAGQGYASVSIADGKIYTLGDNLTNHDDKDYLTCFDPPISEREIPGPRARKVSKAREAHQRLMAIVRM